MAKQKKLTARQQALLELIAQDKTKKEQQEQTQSQTQPQETPLSDIWIMLPLIPYKAVTLLTGPRNTDKTNLAIDLAYSVSSGLRFVYFPILKPGNVLYITSESANLFQQRVKAMNEVYYGIETFYWKSKQDLSIEKDIERIKPVLVVLDKIQISNTYRLLQNWINKYNCGLMIVSEQESILTEYADVVLSYRDLGESKVELNIEETKFDLEYLKFKKIKMSLYLSYKHNFHDINHCY